MDDYNWGLGDNYGGVSLTIQAVPEFSTYGALVGLGALGFAAYRRRRQRATWATTDTLAWKSRGDPRFEALLDDSKNNAPLF